MSLQYTVRPISDRTPFTGRHEYSRFTSTWSQALDLLQREYEQLRGKHLVIEVDVRERDIGKHGQVRADAQAATPAVRVAFESKFGPIVMATDRFQGGGYGIKMHGWQLNVYAIAKSLEALRMVDRYGVTKRGEQYTGWKALPAGSGLVPSGMTTDLALDVITRESNTDPALLVGAGSDVLAVWAKKARANSHPDRNNGDRSRWNAVEEAVQTLARAGRIA